MLLRLNWNDENPFLTALADHIIQHGAPDLVFAWLHQTSQGEKVAEAFLSLCGFTKLSVPCL